MGVKHLSLGKYLGLELHFVRKVLLNICDPVCEKGSYSLFNCMYLATCNLTCECGGITLKFGPLVSLA